MPAPQVEIVVRRPGQPERRMLLGQGVTSLGRAEDNDLVLPDIGVSRRHARIVVNPEQVYVEDLGSGNGTFFAGTRVDRKVLADGDEVVIDPFVLSFRFRAEPTDERRAAEAERPAERDDDGGTARLLVLSGHRLATAYPLGSATLSLGRAEGRDIVLYDPAASRNHARVELREGRYWYADLGSANGSYLNGQRVREQPLSHGDRIRIGTTEFRFESVGAGIALPPARPPEPPTPYVGSPVNLSQPTASRPALAVEPVPEPIVTLPVQPHALEPIPVVPAWDAPGQATVTRRPKPRTSVAVRLLQVAVVLVVLSVAGIAIVLLAAGGVYVLTRQKTEPVAEVVSAPPPPHVVPPEHEKEVNELMDDGRLAFHESRYLDAAARFYKVLKLDPQYGEAERLGFLACEYIAFDLLRDDAVARATPDAERKRRYRDALALAEKALSGKGALGEARVALEEAQIFYPEDGDLSVAQAKVRREIAARAASDAGRRHRETVEVLFDKASGDLDAGRLPAAVEGFERVVAADPEKLTWYAYEANDAIREAKSRMARDAKATVAAGKDAARRKDWPEAERLLEEALRIDPYDDDVRKLLEEVEKKVAG